MVLVLKVAPPCARAGNRLRVITVEQIAAKLIIFHTGAVRSVDKEQNRGPIGVFVFMGKPNRLQRPMAIFRAAMG